MPVPLLYVTGMTQQETRALLARVNPRQLREDAGIRLSTVARAFGVPAGQVYQMETGLKDPPYSVAGFRWVRFVAALERRARSLDAMESEPGDRFW